MTAEELIKALKKLPKNTRIVIPGYEGGYNDASTPIVEGMYALQENVNTGVWYYGNHDLGELKSDNDPDDTIYAVSL